MRRNAPASTNGSRWYVRREGNRRWIAANTTLPTVTIPQNAVSARDAAVADAPTSVVMSSWAQLPLTVSQTP
jgi:hypothetical protein